MTYNQKALNKMIRGLTMFAAAQGEMGDDGWSELCEFLFENSTPASWNEIDSFLEDLKSFRKQAK